MHEDCTTLTSVDSGVAATITLLEGDSYRGTLARFGSVETILSAELTVVDTAEAVRLELGESETSSGGITYVVDTGDGTIVASSTDASIDAVRDMIAITQSPLTATVCTGEVMTGDNSTVLRSGEADVDGDGDLETLSLIATDGVTEVEIVGLAAVEGNVVGTVQFGRTDPEAVLGWADWDGDGLPEIITREPAGPAFGDVHHVHSINGCEIERVTTLVNDMRAGSSDIFVCARDADGVLSELTMLMIRQTPDITPAEITNRTITSIFTAGVPVATETQVTVTNDLADLNPAIDGPINLGSCATLL